MFTGAGASTFFGYPTTEQFINNLKNELTPNQFSSELALLNNILGIKDYKDIEHVLELLDVLQNINKHPFSNLINTYASSINLGAPLGNIDLRNMLLITKNLRNKIQEDVFPQYQFNPQTMQKINEIYAPLMSFLLQSSENYELSVFTTNYDQVIENLCSQNKIDFIDGFKQVDNSEEFE